MKKIKGIVKIIKELWSDKKIRAWIWLGFYFIFFLIISILMRIEPSINENISPSLDDNKSDIEAIMVNINTLSRDDYNYKINIYSVYEIPPAVSVEIVTKTGDFKVGDENVSSGVTTRISAILELK